jgi:hypothetical protein
MTMMGETTDNIEEVYERVYNTELSALERRRANDPTCTIADIEGLLNNLYIWDGHYWRGQVQDADHSATIAAYEHFIAQWKKETAV